MKALSREQDTIKGLAATPRLLTRPKEEAYLRIRPQTLAKWACTRHRKIPYAQVGSRVVYRLADLDAFLEENSR
jgi:hypothetical protein